MFAKVLNLVAPQCSACRRHKQRLPRLAALWSQRARGDREESGLRLLERAHVAPVFVEKGTRGLDAPRPSEPELSTPRARRLLRLHRFDPSSEGRPPPLPTSRPLALPRARPSPPRRHESHRPCILLSNRGRHNKAPAQLLDTSSLDGRHKVAEGHDSNARHLLVSLECSIGYGEGFTSHSQSDLSWLRPAID